MTPIKVFLTGGDGTRWALDDDLRATRESLSGLAPLIEFADLDNCDVVHCMWSEGLAAIESWQLAGKRVVCHLENDLSTLLGGVSMLQVASSVSIWVAQNMSTLQYCRDVGMNAVYVPYAVDVEVFRQDIEPGISRDELTKRWNLPEERFLIGNFMRDSLGADLGKAKDQKGADVFVAMLQLLKDRGLPIHVVLAGPRRHWVRCRLDEAAIPFTYIGEIVDGDDNHINILDKTTLSQLYHTLDVYAVTSRWEGGPRPLLEAIACGCPVISTRVGLAPDLLDEDSLFSSFDEGARLIERELEKPFLRLAAVTSYNKLLETHTHDATRTYFRSLYESVSALPVNPPHDPGMVRRRQSPVVRLAEKVVRRGANFLPGRRRPETRLRISFWHEFQKPPYGGGNQFMLALKGVLESQGVRVDINRLNPDVDVHLCNSTWFDVKRFTRYSERRQLRLLHRIDGPISLYRGTDRELDDEVFALNERLATATVLQSAWSYRQLCGMGYRPVKPILIHNAADDKIFHSNGRAPFGRNPKIRLVASSWSDNPRKGGLMYKWLEENLDWDRYEFTFIGRPSVEFERARHLPAMPSEELAAELRQQDIYITASQMDPCSNALIEAQSCGLPALYFNSGGHPELVANGGLPFTEKEELLLQLDRLVENYPLFQSQINIQSIETIARRYLDAALWVKQQ
jgi:glycosyltransferase involved in cell wall biosynthesis